MSIQALYTTFGEPTKVISLNQSHPNALKKNQVRVKMIGAPINPSDWIPMTGAYAHRITLPQVAGYEGVGIVEEIGADVSPALLGVRVLPLRGEGTWQTHVVCESKWCVLVPDYITDESAAQMYINPCTAYYLVTKTFALKSGDVLVVNGGASSLNTIFAQLAQYLGYTLIIRCRTVANAKHLVNENVILTDDFDESTRAYLHGLSGKITAVDLVGGKSGVRMARLLPEKTHFVCVGLLSGQPVNWLESAPHLQIGLFHLRQANATMSKETWDEMFRVLFELQEKGILKVPSLKKHVPIVDVKNALHEAMKHKGKIYLTI
ncbi:MAG: zinc-dependent alcohol dehydrogenase family protein [Bacilli bacterium]